MPSIRLVLPLLACLLVLAGCKDKDSNAPFVYSLDGQAKDAPAAPAPIRAPMSACAKRPNRPTGEGRGQ